LTYDNENLPEDHSVHKEELQLFFKRLRRKLNPLRISYFACGEYGELKNRPHYHAIIFGYAFPDRKLHTKSNGHLLYTSDLLRERWGKGHVLIGDVTFESCAYVSRYVMKKFKPDKRKKGKDIEEHYRTFDKETGEIFDLNPEFCLSSRNPAIGKRWLQKYARDTDKDFITIRGQKMTLPKYYDKMLEEKAPEEFKDRKFARMAEAAKQAHDNTYERLLVQEKVLIAKTSTLKRGYESYET
jgi:hypothetical protein